MSLNLKANLPEISPENFNCEPFRVWGTDWLVLAAGDYATNKFNAMTVGWGFLGTMWAMPSVIVVVRPQRYTLEFLNKYFEFTLTAFAPAHRSKLAYIGKVSGRDCPDKLAQAGLTPCPASQVSAPAFQEAELLIECRKTYCDEFKPAGFIAKSLVDQIYPDHDFHVCLVGKVVRIAGISKYSK